MSPQVRVGLAIARYGLFLFVFLTQALEPPRLSGLRLIELAALYVILATVGYLFTQGRGRPRVLVPLEVALVFAIGLLAPRGSFWLSYFVVVVDAGFAFGRPPAIYASSVGIYVLLVVNAYLAWRPLDRDFAEALLSLLFGFVFATTATRQALEQMAARHESERLLRQLGEAHEKLQAYAAEVETLSVARERQRLAQEVQDSVAHTLTGLLVQLQAARRTLPTDPGAASARLASLEEVVRRGLDEVRRAVRAMRPENLESVGGIEAMQRLCAEFSERTGIRVTFLAEGQSPLKPAQEVLLYRALQECLTNAARHGRASNVWASLRPLNGRVELRVRDDGAGAAELTAGMGLSGMAERAEASGGRFLFRSSAGAGFESVMELPLDAAVTA
ncbi:MAG TPA: sensor histidine kinase [bacterium]|nr:sensor histidine kinase [bacterium]